PKCGWPAGGQAGDSVGQWQRLREPRVPGGAEGERAGPPPDSAALSGGERDDGAGLPDVAGGARRRGVDELFAGAGGAGEGGALVQRGAVAQRLGLSAAGGVLSRGAGGAPRRAAAETSRGPASAEGNEPGIAAANHPLCGGRTRLIELTRLCARSVETIHQPPMAKHLERDLDNLQRDILSMGTAVEESVAKAIRALQDRD